MAHLRVQTTTISVLGMLIGGGIKSHSEHASFEAAIRDNVQGSRALPKLADLPPMLPVVALSQSA